MLPGNHIKLEHLSEFKLDSDIHYLNHAAVSPWPVRTSNAIKQFADENIHSGASRYSDWLETERKLRKQIKTLLNAPSADDIALLKNTSEFLIRTDNIVTILPINATGDNGQGLRGIFQKSDIIGRRRIE